jgi:translation initiation factor IF-1
VAQFEGVVKAREKSRLVLELPDGNTVTFNITRKTKGAREVKPGDAVVVEALQARDASLDAVVIKKRT